MKSTDEHDGPRGRHTLRVLRGVVVGRYQRDVFVELGERMQGVLAREEFGEAEPVVGEEYEFTLRGQEETLWVVSLAERPVLSTWESMEVGCLVEVRVVRGKVGGLEGMVGKLHAFLPKSQTGLPRGTKAEELIGKNLVCQVVEVDAERQRVIVSRRAVEKNQGLASKAASEGRLLPGMRVDGRVVRVERYGIFLRFGRGLTGLAHRSELAWGHVGDARELFEKGQTVPAVVLTVRQEGKRISLGTKQLLPNPWNALERERAPGDLLAGRVVAVRDWGSQVEVQGVVGYLSGPELRAARGRHGKLSPGEDVVVRVVAFDAELERLSLSLRDAMGRVLVPEDLEPSRPVEGEGRFGAGLGRLLAQALPPPGSRATEEHNAGDPPRS